MPLTATTEQKQNSSRCFIQQPMLLFDQLCDQKDSERLIEWSGTQRDQKDSERLIEWSGTQRDQKDSESEIEWGV